MHSAVPTTPSRALLLSLVLLSATATAADYSLVGWNDLGMHCMDGRDFSVFSVLPPFNTVHAQLTYRGTLVTNTTGLTVTFEAVADATGSINRTSIGKGNFWQYAEALYGSPLAPDVGLAGISMPGTNNQPQPMSWDAAARWFTAEGIPITPYDDQLRKNYYPMMRLVARNSSGTVLARTDIVLPVSDEMDCRACHRSGSSAAAQPPSGWTWDCDPERDYKLNILRLHDETRPTSSIYISALNRVGYNPAGLVATVVQDAKPVLCLRCHPSNALPGSGTTAMRPFTRVIHGQHALVIDPETGLSLNDTANRASCYRCHPGRDTRCLRGPMGNAVAPDGARSIQCQDCHGNLSAVAATTRKGWLDEPNCQSCHTGTASRNNGQIRYDSVFESPGVVRQAVDVTFATQPDTPTNGLSLYRFSRGHGGLYCAACHGSPHAEYPSAHANDNVQSTQLQGHKGVLVECSTCHVSTPATVNGGPHGMHPVGSTWISGHKNPGKSPTQCQACHGTDYRGTVLSLSQADRTFTAFGTKRFWRGFRIGCYNCHNGASNNNQNSNRPASVSNTSAFTTAEQPVAIPLTASDADNNSLSLRIVDPPSHGTVALTNRQATYYPEPGYAGPDRFTFAAWDGSTDSNLGTVSLSIGQGNCLLTASSTVPLAGQTGTAIPFHAAALLTQCATNISFVWTFGDGTTVTNLADACHLYNRPGTYAWTLLATAGSATQTLQGVITIEAAPVTDVLLTITGNGTTLEISWPGEATGYSLESTGNLNPPIAWLPAGQTPQLITGRWVVTLPKPAVSQFYRLAK